MAKAILVQTGDRYGRLEIIREIQRTSYGYRQVECRCNCGTVIPCALQGLRSGNTTSCGCRKNEATSSRSRIHGEAHKTPEYRTWKGMITRCYNSNDSAYLQYGGRGIAVCPEWRHDYLAFLSHVGRRPSPKHSIDRWPNNDGNYEPGNVRWATRKEQSRNTSKNIWVDYNGSQRLLIEVCEELGVSYDMTKRRRLLGWPDSKLFGC